MERRRKRGRRTTVGTRPSALLGIYLRGREAFNVQREQWSSAHATWTLTFGLRVFEHVFRFRVLLNLSSVTAWRVFRELWSRLQHCDCGRGLRGFTGRTVVHADLIKCQTMSMTHSHCGTVVLK